MDLGLSNLPNLKEVRLTTPPPPRRDSLAALTMKVVARVVIEVFTRDILEFIAESGLGEFASKGSNWRREVL